MDAQPSEAYGKMHIKPTPSIFDNFASSPSPYLPYKWRVVTSHEPNQIRIQYCTLWHVILILLQQTIHVFSLPCRVMKSGNMMKAIGWALKLKESVMTALATLYLCDFSITSVGRMQEVRRFQVCTFYVKDIIISFHLLLNGDTHFILEYYPAGWYSSMTYHHLIIGGMK